MKRGEPAGFADQRLAADPATSAWVMANAGSGKTRVLTDRVIRLLLNGTRPSAILCLTFTKAAAAEMANRLHLRLGAWAVMPATALRKELTQLLGRSSSTDEMTLARQLFARTLDAAGRLRIQTIHAFCESLLKRFPLESDVPPHFAIADEATSRELLDEARGRLLTEAAADDELNKALALVVGEVEELGFQGVIAELVADRRKLRHLFATQGDDIERVITVVRRTLGVGDETAETLRTNFLAGLAEADLRRGAAALDGGSSADSERAQRIRTWLKAPDRAGTIETDWCSIFLTDKGTPRKVLMTQKAQQRDAGALAILETEQRRVGAFCDRLKSVTVAQATAALLRLGKRLLDLYREAKNARALLDYDDLIFLSGEVLRRQGLASWVLFKLDGGIDHVLVDEAQDTSPEQWEVIAALCAEFFAGEGAHGRPRTVFAVGDAKQSIFSFQGADPEAFVAMRRHFERRVQAASQAFKPVELKISFRSCAAVLTTVDAIFSRAEARDGVGEGEIRHLPHRIGAGGLVELWPPAVPQENKDSDPWDAPLDYVGAASPPVVLADRIAGTIRGWLDKGERLASRDRAIRPGDILILVRRRDAFFETMVRALKAADVAVAGADRMVLAEQLAVMDLVALAQFALLPEDDLNLAVVLKGPLFGLDDDDLFLLCHGRTRRLWPTLRAHAGERPAWRRAADELSALLARADRVPPFEFFAAVLGVERGRARILARLGAEAADPIDEFLSLTLAYERQGVPTLEGFLAWFAAGGAEVKRDMEQNRDEVRVMTVHGAKGLESNIVFLPDTCAMPDGRNDKRLLWTDDRVALPLWPIRTSNDDAACGVAREAMRRAREREYRRLLYVATTRARDRLYVCGWQGEKRPNGCWHDLIAPAIESDARAQPIALPWGEAGRRIRIDQSGPVEADAQTLLVAQSGGLPEWAKRGAPAEPDPARPLAPSRPEIEPTVVAPLVGNNATRFRRGLLIHRLLQTLPELPSATRAEAARRFLARAVHALDPATQEEILGETLAVLDHPDFADFFGADCVAEVPVVGRLQGRVIAAQLDRIVVREKEVLVLDYKTRRPVPMTIEAVPQPYLKQMAAYRTVLTAIYPGRAIRCCLLWTEGPRLMELPADVLERHAPR